MRVKGDPGRSDSVFGNASQAVERLARLARTLGLHQIVKTLAYGAYRCGFDEASSTTPRSLSLALNALFSSSSTSLIDAMLASLALSSSFS